MEKIKKLSTAATIICMVSVVIYIVLAIIVPIYGYGSLMGFAEDNMGKLDQIDSNSPSAGFEVLAYLAGGALGFLGGLFIIILAFFLGFLALYQVPAIVTGFIANSQFKKNQDVSRCLKYYKTDGFVKAIMNGIVLGCVILTIVGDLKTSSILDILIALALVWNYIAVFVLGILQIKNIEIEEKA